jgi:hypothetical protein
LGREAERVFERWRFARSSLARKITIFPGSISSFAVFILVLEAGVDHIAHIAGTTALFPNLELVNHNQLL